jgi:hypothetical protein
MMDDRITTLAEARIAVSSVMSRATWREEASLTRTEGLPLMHPALPPLIGRANLRVPDALDVVGPDVWDRAFDGIRGGVAGTLGRPCEWKRPFGSATPRP